MNVTLDIKANTTHFEVIDAGAQTVRVNVGQGAAASLLICPDSIENQDVVAVLERDARLEITFIDISNHDFKRQTLVSMEHSGASCALNGVFIVGGQRQCDNLTVVKHLAPMCNSEQNFRGIATNEGKGLFNGHILVAEGAQQTVAVQQNHNIILSDKAKIHTEPKLEIYADDVQCNHGATVGRRNEDALYYMRQRGITPSDAQTLLLESFCRAAVDLTGFEAATAQSISDRLSLIIGRL